jgi:dTDP-4-dehydrorhamnose 3,5-epimerase
MLLAYKETGILDHYVVRRNTIIDNRGFFERFYCGDELQGILGTKKVSQITRPFTMARGTLRGLHFQKAPYSEAKIVSCLRVEVFDVAVDLRPTSPIYLQWHSEILSEPNRQSLEVPEGFAHGCETLRNAYELLYRQTAPFNSQSERGGGKHLGPAARDQLAHDNF